MTTKVEFKDISNFVHVARTGSLTRAGMISGVPKATLSHSIRRLEDLLEVELFRMRRLYPIDFTGSPALTEKRVSL